MQTSLQFVKLDCSWFANRISAVQPNYIKETKFIVHEHNDAQCHITTNSEKPFVGHMDGSNFGLTQSTLCSKRTYRSSYHTKEFIYYIM